MVVDQADDQEPSECDVGRRIRWLQFKRAMRTVPVVGRYVAAKDPIQMPAPDDEQPVQALGTDSTHPALRVGIRIRRLQRCQQYLARLTRRVSSSKKNSTPSRRSQMVSTVKQEDPGGLLR
jgi:hypothetical protein